MRAARPGFPVVRMPGHQLRFGRVVEAYLDDALSPAARARVGAHLRECWPCSEEAELLRMVKTSLRHRPQRVCSLELARLHRFAERVATDGDAGRV